MPAIDKLNNLSIDEKKTQLKRCCHCKNWVKSMTAIFPIKSSEELFHQATKIWENLTHNDWLEAFSGHPKIGEKQLRDKFASTANWSSQEQQGVSETSEEILVKLAKGNKEYEQKFGYIFIVCATGKSANEMLAILEKRLNNNPEQEIKIAANQQDKITIIRLQKLLDSLEEN